VEWHGGEDTRRERDRPERDQGWGDSGSASRLAAAPPRS
jgi:hypothetical protein